MPYIPDEFRKIPPATVGDFNFAITKLIDSFIRKEGLSYSAINAAIGVLECAKLELYRRIGVPYETEKMQINGDVYSKENLK